MAQRPNGPPASYSNGLFASVLSGKEAKLVLDLRFNELRAKEAELRAKEAREAMLREQIATERNRRLDMQQLMRSTLREVEHARTNRQAFRCVRCITLTAEAKFLPCTCRVFCVACAAQLTRAECPMCGGRVDELDVEGQRVPFLPRIHFERAPSRGLEEEELEVD